MRFQALHGDGYLCCGLHMETNVSEPQHVLRAEFHLQIKEKMGRRVERAESIQNFSENP
jgi:hypothetical protein